ncbi:MAG: response regulator [Flavobacterium sp.]|nr:response regulator [Flavobacterium sp.]
MMTNNFKSVAIIDDDKIFQQIIKKTIGQIETIENIYTFSDGKEAIDYFGIYSSDIKMLPDVIFLDLNMPNMNGWEFLEAYFLLEPNLAKKSTIYIVSSSVDPNDLIKVKASNEVSDYLVKPLNIEFFTQILRPTEQ